MVRVVPPCIDTRNEIQREMDTAVRSVHETYGDELRGYIIIAYDAPENASVSMMTDIRRIDLPDWVADIVEEVLYGRTTA